MPAKYHINPETGNPGICRATKQCKFGDISSHYASRDEARQVYESKMGSLNVNLRTIKASTVKKAINKKNSKNNFDSTDVLDDSFNNEDHGIDYTPDTVQNKFDSDIRGTTHIITSTSDGASGDKLEELFGKSRDAEAKADLGTVELKTLKNSTSSKVTLTSKSVGSPSAISERFGATDENGKKKIYTTMGKEWNTSKVYKHEFRVVVDRKTEVVKIQARDKDSKKIVSDGEYAWKFSDLNKKVDDKLSQIAIGYYDVDKNSSGEKTATYTDLKIGGFTRDSFIDKIESGDITVDFRISGSRDHGTSFRAHAKVILGE